MNTTEQLTYIRSKCVEAVPGILDLKFGCEVLVDSEIMITTHWNSSNDSLDVYAPKRDDSMFHTFNLYPKDYEIIGRPIQLADIIFLFRKECINISTPEIVNAWNLLDDNLDHQSSETISFIFELLS